MAFLDNSGDIILDAVLTDLGRKRMTNGDFVITNFGLGDDEINYGTYNLAHPSGSAYYDLEIMQTPVFEATTSRNANINYGLQTLASDSLLYLPAINFNLGKVSDSVNTYYNMFYVATNEETWRKLTALTALATNTVRAGSTTHPFIIFEAGLDTFDISATQANRLSYIVNQTLEDTSFIIEADSQFITAVGSLTAASYWKNAADNAEEISLALDYTGITPGASAELANYNTYTVRAIANQITEPTTGTGNDNDISAIKGPRGTTAALNFFVPAGMQTEAGGSVDPVFVNHGTVGGTIPGDTSGNKYDYIDTIVYITGQTSGATAQASVRLIRLNTAA